jgi:hypothetical protein
VKIQNEKGITCRRQEGAKDSMEGKRKLKKSREKRKEKEKEKVQRTGLKGIVIAIKRQVGLQ